MMGIRSLLMTSSCNGLRKVPLEIWREHCSLFSGAFRLSFVIYLAGSSDGAYFSTQKPRVDSRRSPGKAQINRSNPDEISTEDARRNDRLSNHSTEIRACACVTLYNGLGRAIVEQL